MHIRACALTCRTRGHHHVPSCCCHPRNEKMNPLSYSPWHHNRFICIPAFWCPCHLISHDLSKSQQETKVANMGFPLDHPKHQKKSEELPPVHPHFRKPQLVMDCPRRDLHHPPITATETTTAGGAPALSQSSGAIATADGRGWKICTGRNGQVL